MSYSQAEGTEVTRVKRLASSALLQIYEIADKDLLEAELRAAQGIKSARTKVRVLLAKIANLAKQARRDIPATGDLNIQEVDSDEKVCS